MLQAVGTVLGLIGGRTPWIASLPNESEAVGRTFEERLSTVGFSTFYIS
jgi:hypothetical protein